MSALIENKKGLELGLLNSVLHHVLYIIIQDPVTFRDRFLKKLLCLAASSKTDMDASNLAQNFYLEDSFSL